jgi:hypothetical protein
MKEADGIDVADERAESAQARDMLRRESSIA